MEIALLEIVLWAGLIFFFWVLKENLGKVETDLEKHEAERLLAARNKSVPDFKSPERLFEPIGYYRDAPIYRFAIISGRCYCFESVCPIGPFSLTADQACLQPGLLYVACE